MESFRVPPTSVPSSAFSKDRSAKCPVRGLHFAIESQHLSAVDLEVWSPASAHFGLGVPFRSQPQKVEVSRNARFAVKLELRHLEGLSAPDSAYGLLIEDFCFSGLDTTRPVILFGLILFGRGGGIRTRDPLRPRQVRYQAALRPDIFTV